jgi:hypothetical protein
MRFGLDSDDVAEALLDVTPLRQRRVGGFGAPATAHDDDVRAVASQIKRFLAELPGEVSVSELRDVLDEAIARPGEPT